MTTLISWLEYNFHVERFVFSKHYKTHWLQLYALFIKETSCHFNNPDLFKKSVSPSIHLLHINLPEKIYANSSGMFKIQITREPDISYQSKSKELFLLTVFIRLYSVPL